MIKRSKLPRGISSVSSKRDIVHDTHAISLEDRIDRVSGNKKKEGSESNTSYLVGNEGNTIPLSSVDYNKLYEMFERFGGRLNGSKAPFGFHFNGCEYTFKKDECKFFKRHDNALKVIMTYTRGDGSRPADIDKRNGDERKYIQVTYSLYMHNTNGPVLSFIGNPTTIVNGNNISPIRFEGLSRFHENLMFYKIGFHLLESIFPFKFSKTVRKKLVLGDFRTPNTQLTLLFGTEQKDIDIGLLCGLYCSRAADRGKSVALGEYLGFSTNNPYKGLTGVFLSKKQGNNPYLTVNVYDKKQSVANKKQGKTLTVFESEIVDKTLRFDITLHSAFLESMIKEAKKRLRELIKIDKRFNKLVGHRQHSFITVGFDGIENKETTHKDVTAYRICRAMQILSLNIVDGKIVNSGFSSWLIDVVFDKELRLIPILEYQQDSLDKELKPTKKEKEDGRLRKRFDKVKHLLDYWRTYEGFDILSDYQEAFKVSKVDFYRYRRTLKERISIDVSIPYMYWIDLALLSSNYGFSTEQKKDYYRITKQHQDMTPEDIGNAMIKFAKKSKLNMKNDKQGLLNSLKLVAKRVEAKPYDPELITRD